MKAGQALYQISAANYRANFEAAKADLAAAKAVGYVGAGTVEFIAEQDGRFYFMEEVQFVATYNYLRQQSNVTTIRQGAKGLFISASGDCTVRGAAWCNRTLAQAAIVSPDGDAVGTDLKTSLEENISWNHARYVAQANNPYGLVEPYVSSYGQANGHQIEAPWQQDFYTAAFGFMLAARPSISSAAPSSTVSPGCRPSSTSTASRVRSPRRTLRSSTRPSCASSTVAR